MVKRYKVTEVTFDSPALLPPVTISLKWYVVPCDKPKTIAIVEFFSKYKFVGDQLFPPSIDCIKTTLVAPSALLNPRTTADGDAPFTFKSEIGTTLFSTYTLLFLRIFVRAYTVRTTFIAHGVPSTNKKFFTMGNFIVSQLFLYVCYPKLTQIIGKRSQPSSSPMKTSMEKTIHKLSKQDVMTFAQSIKENWPHLELDHKKGF